MQKQNSNSVTSRENTKKSGIDKLQEASLQCLYTEVFVWGSDACGQLGLEMHKKKGDQQSHFYDVPKSCSFNVLIKQISCGAHHTAMLTQTGHLYMMG